jgi:diguanylate cyclase (GGDEF)-like protein/PAS domain S-box-containing protein
LVNDGTGATDIRDVPVHPPFDPLRSGGRHRSADRGPDADEVEAAFRRLIAAHPSARVTVLDAGGGISSVPVPTSLHVPGLQALEVHTGLDLFVSDDRVRIAKLWDEARRTGRAEGTVRLRSDRDHPGRISFFDLTRAHGVVVVVFTEGAADGGGPRPSRPRPAVRPRSARSTKDASAVFLSVDQALTAMLGWTSEELVGRRALEFVHPDDHEAGIDHWMHMLDNPGQPSRVRLRHRHRDGTWVWLEVTNSNCLSDADRGHVVAEMIDVSNEMAALEALRARERLLSQLTDAVPVGLFHADLDGRLLVSNLRLQTITGVPVAATVDEQFAAVNGAGRRAVRDAVRAARAGHPSEARFDLEHDDGSFGHFTISVRPVIDESGEACGVIGCVEDLTEMVRTNRDLQQKAARDPLTGCLNRDAILRTLQRLVDQPAETAGSRSGTAVIFVDLDGFKSINDRHGHSAGDEILVELAMRIRAATRSGDLLGRMGGDEFVVICPDVADPDSALQLARALDERAFRHWRPRLALTGLRASMGVAWADGPPVTAHEMLRSADAAMYRSKRAGGGDPVLAA